MRNTLSDLNNYLFEQLERLNDDELDENTMQNEINRSDAVIKVAKTIIDNGALALQTKKHLDEYGAGDKYMVPLLGIASNDKA